MASISSSSSSSSPNNPFRFVWRMYHSITMQYLRLSPPIPMNIPDQLHGTSDNNQHPVVGYDYEPTQVVIAAADSSRSHGSSSSAVSLTSRSVSLFHAIRGGSQADFPSDDGLLYQPHSLPFTARSPPFPFPSLFLQANFPRFLRRLHVPNGVVLYSVSPYWGQDSPLHYHDFDIERQQYFQPLTIPQSQSQSQSQSHDDGGQVHLGKTFLSLTFQAGVGLMVFYYQSLLSSSSSSSHDIKSLLPPPLALHIVEAAMTLGFAGSLIGILLRSAYPILAGIIEKTGSIFASLGFFVMVCMLLPGFFIWIGWLGGVGSVLAFGVAVKKMKRA